MRDERKQIVAAGYDRMAGEYLDWAARVEGDPRDRTLQAFASRLPAFFSGFDAGANRGLLGAAGFEMVLDEIVEMLEPEGLATFHWVIAAKPAVR